MTIKKTDIKSGSIENKLNALISKDQPEPGAQRVYPQKLIASSFTLPEIRLLGKWVKSSDYEPFLKGILSLRYGDFRPEDIQLIAEAVDEGISEGILDRQVGSKLKALLIPDM